jgi:hypothetical protein
MCFGITLQTNVVNASNECVGFEPPGTVLPILSETGSFEKIIVYEEFYADSDDAEDVSAAVRAAQLKAKASLSKFLGEETETEDTLMEMSKSLKEKGTEGKLVTSERLKVQIQNVKSKSKQVLRGLIKLSDCFEPDTKRVMVELGTNLRLMAASNEIKNAFENTQTEETSPVDSDDDSGENTQSGFTRSSKAKSDF